LNPQDPCLQGNGCVNINLGNDRSVMFDNDRDTMIFVLMRISMAGSGSDNDACTTTTSPLKTFQVALALTIDGGALATSGAGITISAGANDVVNSRGLNIDGANAGASGIELTERAGLLHMEADHLWQPRPKQIVSRFIRRYLCKVEASRV